MQGNLSLLQCCFQFLPLAARAKPKVPMRRRVLPQADESLKQAQDAQRRQAAAAAAARERERRGGGPAWPGGQWLRGLFGGQGLFGGPGLFGCGGGAAAGGGFAAPAAPAQCEASGSGSSEDALIDLTLEDDEPPAQEAQQAQRGQAWPGRGWLQQTVKEEEDRKPEDGDGGGGDSDWEPDDLGGE